MRTNLTKYVRIHVGAKRSYLVYQRGWLQLIQAIEKSSYYDKRPLRTAYRYLRDSIQVERAKARLGDAYRDREPGRIYDLLRRKRERVWRQALESKRPVNDTRHVGVEIEFLSRSSRSEIAQTLARLGVAPFVELKSDGSVQADDEDSNDCDGSCREECECSYCHETHYCDDVDSCNQRTRNNEGRTAPSHWEYRDDCRDCSETEYIDDCHCDGGAGCVGDHVVCEGHCTGHNCEGYDDHPDYDCSCECTCSSGSGHEIAIVAKSNQIAGVIKKVCEGLAEHDAEVNKTCGLHVHLDMRNVSSPETSFARLVKCQRLLYSMVPKSRYKNQYCKPNTSSVMDSYDGRYWGINPKSYTEHETIEIRLHSGSVNAEKITNWIKILQRIAYSRRKLGKTETLADISDAVGFTQSQLDYIKLRIEAFADDHGAYSLPIKRKRASSSQSRSPARQADESQVAACA